MVVILFEPQNISYRNLKGYGTFDYGLFDKNLKTRSGSRILILKDSVIS